MIALYIAAYILVGVLITFVIHRSGLGARLDRYVCDDNGRPSDLWPDKMCVARVGFASVLWPFMVLITIWYGFWSLFDHLSTITLFTRKP